MSFKYRFIISFVLLEIFFILLIVSVNFFTINSSSKKLTDEKISSNITFLKELLSVPISVYDLATLDNLVEKTSDLNYINSIVVLDKQNRIISKKYNFKHETLDDFLSQYKNRSITLEDETYEVHFTKMYEENDLIGSFYLIFDTSDNTKFIQDNKFNTIFIIILEILLSTIISYLIGSKLTRMLTNLSSVAQEIGNEKRVEIPYIEKKNEIGILSRSLNQMQEDLIQRKNKLQDYTNELKEQKDELKKANKTKDEFLANMSHEIRTPLNAIIGFSDILKKSKLDEYSRNQAEIISKSANSLLSIINEILDFSKIESGKIDIIPESNSFKELLKEIHTLFSVKASEKNLVFKCNFDDSIPSYMLFDKIRLQQVISNLISNAIKFTPQKGNVSLEAKLLSQTNTNASLYIEVKDNGIGISKDKQESIFKPFVQEDISTTKEYGGTGLGLSIISRILNLMGSKIEIKSEKEKGSKFYFIIDFPICEKIKVQESEDNITDTIPLTGKILVAEDNPINQELMEAMLDNLSLKTDFANDGEEAILKYEETDYDIIFMDINMPKCDGLVATSVIREYEYKNSKKHVPIIALTANVIKGDTQKYLDAGMDEHIGKPINFNKLKKVLEKYLIN